MRALTPAEDAALSFVCKRVEVEPYLLAALIEFESSWQPLIKNRLSSARGLIQFMDRTAHRLGYADPKAPSEKPWLDASRVLLEAHPDTVSQLLCPVLRYLYPMKPFPTDQSLFMAVFYPAYRKVDPGTPFPERVRRSNQGIITVNDYLQKVWRRVGNIDIASEGQT